MGTQDKRKGQTTQERRVLRVRRQHNNMGPGRVSHPGLSPYQSLSCPFRRDSHESSPALHLPKQNQGIHIVSKRLPTDCFLITKGNMGPLQGTTWPDCSLTKRGK